MPGGRRIMAPSDRRMRVAAGGMGEEGVRMDSCQAIPMLPCILPLEKSQNCYTCMP